MAYYIEFPKFLNYGRIQLYSFDSKLKKRVVNNTIAGIGRLLQYFEIFVNFQLSIVHLDGIMCQSQELWTSKTFPPQVPAKDQKIHKWTQCLCSNYMQVDRNPNCRGM